MVREIPNKLLLKLKNLSNKEKFELIYWLLTGLIETKELTGYQKELSKYVIDETEPFGSSYKAYKEIENLLIQVKDMEFDLRKDNFMEGGITYKLHEQIDNYSKTLCEKIFEYGLKIGETERT